MHVDHGSVATKIKTRFIAPFFMVADKILLLSSFSSIQPAYFSSTTYNHFMNETTVNFVQNLKILV